jgi:hypothetical protein
VIARSPASLPAEEFEAEKRRILGASKTIAMASGWRRLDTAFHARVDW